MEAIDRGWWDGLVRPSPEKTPRVYLGVAGSTLRRTRGGFKQLLNELWPKLKLIISCDIRMSTTAYFSDIVLPAAGFYEKVDFRFPTAHVNYLTFTDQAVQPPGEAKPEWEIFALLAKKMEQRAKQREHRRLQRRRRAAASTWTTSTTSSRCTARSRSATARSWRRRW